MGYCSAVEGVRATSAHVSKTCDRLSLVRSARPNLFSSHDWAFYAGEFLQDSNAFVPQVESYRVEGWSQVEVAVGMMLELLWACAGHRYEQPMVVDSSCGGRPDG